MCAQLELFESANRLPHAYSVFLALFPKQDAVQHIANHAPSIRGHHGLTGRLRPLDHLHISLHWLGDFPEVPQSVSPAIAQACQRIADQTSPLEIQLDRVTSYRGRPGNHPLVLRGNDDTPPHSSGFNRSLSWN
jgi:2'-5' RNA ligase